MIYKSIIHKKNAGNFLINIFFTFTVGRKNIDKIAQTTQSATMFLDSKFLI